VPRHHAQNSPLSDVFWGNPNTPSAPENDDVIRRLTYATLPQAREAPKKRLEISEISNHTSHSVLETYVTSCSQVSNQTSQSDTYVTCFDIEKDVTRNVTQDVTQNVTRDVASRKRTIVISSSSDSDSSEGKSKLNETFESISTISSFVPEVFAFTSTPVAEESEVQFQKEPISFVGFDQESQDSLRNDMPRKIMRRSKARSDLQTSNVGSYVQTISRAQGQSDLTRDLPKITVTDGTLENQFEKTKSESTLEFARPNTPKRFKPKSESVSQGSLQDQNKTASKSQHISSSNKDEEAAQWSKTSVSSRASKSLRLRRSVPAIPTCFDVSIDNVKANHTVTKGSDTRDLTDVMDVSFANISVSKAAHDVNETSTRKGSLANLNSSNLGNKSSSNNFRSANKSKLMFIKPSPSHPKLTNAVPG
jgi:hypothetical protein